MSQLKKALEKRINSQGKLMGYNEEMMEELIKKAAAKTKEKRRAAKNKAKIYQ